MSVIKLTPAIGVSMFVATETIKPEKHIDLDGYETISLDTPNVVGDTLDAFQTEPSKFTRVVLDATKLAFQPIGSVTIGKLIYEIAGYIKTNKAEINVVVLCNPATFQRMGLQSQFLVDLITVLNEWGYHYARNKSGVSGQTRNYYTGQEIKPGPYVTHDRKLPLMAQQPSDKPILTVEKYDKWYDMHILNPDGTIQSLVEDLGFHLFNQELKSNTSSKIDHNFHPELFRKLATENDWYIDSNAMELVAGRWAIEYHKQFDEVTYFTD